MRIKLGCNQHSIGWSGCKSDPDDLVERMLFVNSASLGERKLDELEAVALYQRCPSCQ